MSHIHPHVNTSSGANMQEEPAKPPLPPRVHEFVVSVADRGPSSRALGITVVAAFAASVLLLFAMPKPDPHAVTLQAPPNAPVHSAVPPQVEPVPPVIRSDAVVKPSPVVPAAAVATAAPMRPERVEPPVRIDEQPARIVEVSRNEPPPAVGATGRAPIDIVVAPQMAPRDREPPIVSSVMSRDELTPRPPPAALEAKSGNE